MPNLCCKISLSHKQTSKNKRADRGDVPPSSIPRPPNRCCPQSQPMLRWSNKIFPLFKPLSLGETSHFIQGFQKNIFATTLKLFLIAFVFVFCLYRDAPKTPAPTPSPPPPIFSSCPYFFGSTTRCFFKKKNFSVKNLVSSLPKKRVQENYIEKKSAVQFFLFF